jgi:hypothetical protein
VIGLNQLSSTHSLTSSGQPGLYNLRPPPTHGPYTWSTLGVLLIRSLWSLTCTVTPTPFWTNSYRSQGHFQRVVIASLLSTTKLKFEKFSRIFFKYHGYYTSDSQLILLPYYH